MLHHRLRHCAAMKKQRGGSEVFEEVWRESAGEVVAVLTKQPARSTLLTVCSICLYTLAYIIVPSHIRCYSLELLLCRNLPYIALSSVVMVLISPR